MYKCVEFGLSHIPISLSSNGAIPPNFVSVLVRIMTQ